MNTGNNPMTEIPASWWRRLPKTDGERGSALIMVIGILSVCLVMIAHIVMVSELVRGEAYQLVTHDSMRYQVESAAEVAFWMNANDRRLFSDRTLGQSPENNEFRESADFPPWMLDGRPHEFDDGACIVYMNSAENGFDVNSPSALKNYVDSEDTDKMDLVDDFIDALSDYMDGNDLVQLNGLENDDYTSLGFPTLPRNDQMEFKAELYWIPGWRDAIPGAIRTITPKGISYSGSKNQSFFSATDTDFTNKLDLTDDELAAIHEARRLWETEGIELADSLDAALLLDLKNNFSFTEAGLGQILAIAYDDNDTGFIEYRVVRETNLSSKSIFADKNSQTLSIWERTLR